MVTCHAHIWDESRDLGQRGDLLNFDVDANPKISISIPAASPKVQVSPQNSMILTKSELFSAKSSPPAVGWGEGPRFLDRGGS